MRHPHSLRSIHNFAFALFTATSLLSAGCSIKAADKPPTAVATASAAEVKVGTVVTLDASQSTDPNKNPLTFNWTLKAPAGSKASIAKPRDAKTSFTADVQGVYAITLEVTNSKS